jgi:hypothetical protein
VDGTRTRASLSPDSSVIKQESIRSKPEPVCETLDTTEARLLDAIADAQLEKRGLVVEALERKLAMLRDGRSAPNVILAAHKFTKSSS